MPRRDDSIDSLLLNLLWAIDPTSARETVNKFDFHYSALARPASILYRGNAPQQCSHYLNSEIRGGGYLINAKTLVDDQTESLFQTYVPACTSG